MNKNLELIIVWASIRVSYLDNLERYEDSYAVSQEFCEWTTSINNITYGSKIALLKVPDFNKENRTN